MNFTISTKKINSTKSYYLAFTACVSYPGNLIFVSTTEGTGQIRREQILAYQRVKGAMGNFPLHTQKKHTYI